MFDAKFVQEIAALATGKAAPLVFQPEAEPGHVYLLRQPDGSYERHEAPVGPRDEAATRIDSLAALAATGSEPAVWVGRDQVVLALDGPTGRGRVTLDRQQSAPLALLREWNGRTMLFAPKELYQLLRTKLADAVAANHPGLIAKVGKIDVKKTQETVGEIAKGKVSLDRSMLATASGIDDLPDELILSVPLFERPADLSDRRADVRVAFELDPERERYVLDVMPGEIARADAQADAVLAAAIGKALDQAKARAPVYFGTP